MCVYLHTKFQVSSVILKSFRHEGSFSFPSKVLIRQDFGHASACHTRTKKKRLNESVDSKTVLSRAKNQLHSLILLLEKSEYNYLAICVLKSIFGHNSKTRINLNTGFLMGDKK